MVFLETVKLDTVLKRVGNTNGGEYAGACPWCGGTDRFRVWSKTGRYWCRQCDRWGDAIDYVRERQGIGYIEACEHLGISPDTKYMTVDTYQRTQGEPVQQIEPVPARAAEPLEPPGVKWQHRAWEFVFDCQANLIERNVNPKAREWLHSRGLFDEVLWKFGIGYNPTDRHEKPGVWGLEQEKDIFMPRGITIPWVIDSPVENQLWRVNIRRPTGKPKYLGPAGWSNGLFNADGIRPGEPVLLVEGELDALTAYQCAGDLAVPVATGSTSGSRRTKWLARLASASIVLVAFDTDDAGEKAARYWLDMLPNGKRWRPLWEDVNAMAFDGMMVRRWLRAGLGQTELLKQIAGKMLEEVGG